MDTLWFDRGGGPPGQALGGPLTPPRMQKSTYLTVLYHFSFPAGGAPPGPRGGPRRAPGHKVSTGIDQKQTPFPWTNTSMRQMSSFVSSAGSGEQKVAPHFGSIRTGLSSRTETIRRQTSKERNVMERRIPAVSNSEDLLNILELFAAGSLHKQEMTLQDLSNQLE